MSYVPPLPEPGVAASIPTVNRSDPSITDTEFSTAGRLTAAEILAQRERFLGNGAVTAVLEALPEAVFVFNLQRQLVHANAPALQMVDQVGVDGALGLRLGELLGCEHTIGALEGCGGAAACENCAAIGSLLAALGGDGAQGVCTLHLEKDGRIRTEKFYVRASALHVGDLRLLLLVMVPDRTRKAKSKAAAA